MPHKRRNTIILLIGDIIALYIALGITIAVKYFGDDIAYAWSIHSTPFFVVFVLWILIFSIAGLYDQYAWSANAVVRERIARTMVVSTVIAIILFYLIPAFGITPKSNLLIQATLSLVLLLGWRWIAGIIIRASSKTSVLFIGTSAEVVDLACMLTAHPHLGYTVVALVTAENETHLPPSIPILPFNNNLPHEIRERGVMLIVASKDIRSDQELLHILYEVLPTGIRFMDFPTFYESITGKIPLSLISEAWFIENLVGTRKALYEFAKRVFDLFLALIVGIAFCILFPFITLGIILSTPREILRHKELRARIGDGIIFFSQPRVGKNGKLFNFIKFRSQRLGSERMSEAKEIKHDARRYAFGMLLRAFYLDELPQVWNVIKGDMSFIGPRPERPTYVADLKHRVPFYEMRLLVPPGITGWAQVQMKNDASVEDAPEKIQYDLSYIKNRSLMLDITIAVKTILVMLSRAGR